MVNYDATRHWQNQYDKMDENYHSKFYVLMLILPFFLLTGTERGIHKNSDSQQSPCTTEYCTLQFQGMYFNQKVDR